MLIVPYPSMQESASVLETLDLREAIRSCRDYVLNNNDSLKDPRNSSIIAKYGMVLSAEYKTRTNKELVKQTFWLSHFNGDPRWTLDFKHWQHRSMLVLLGYCRALCAQGLSVSYVSGLIESSRNDLKKVLESKIKPDNRERQYSQFVELPGLWPLHQSTVNT